MIKAVIFDYGNVISKAATGDASEDLKKLSGIPAEVFNSVYERFRFDFDRGLISGEEMYRKLLLEDGYIEQANNSELLKKIALCDLESWRPIRDDVCTWIDELQTKGFKIGILSNMPYEFLDLYESEIPPFVQADFACFSCRVKLIKPEKEIYEYTLNGLGIKADEAVFFDDVQENVDGALKVGIKAFLWTGLEKGKKDLSDILISTSQ